MVALSLTTTPASAATACTTSSVNVVAHPDDDLFFLNPAILQTIASGGCATTAYVTSGDAGGEDSYYLGRESGVEAAYAQMAGVTNKWTTTRVTLAGKSVTRAVLTAQPALTLYFLRLPDGYIDGAGSERSNYKSLEQLELGSTANLQTLDRTTRGRSWCRCWAASSARPRPRWCAPSTARASTGTATTATTWPSVGWPRRRTTRWHRGCH
jgi:hypothetical protein